ncbi:MAG TPA: alpha/beta hydrolase [Geodermatophilus sp.]|nr:alpha/beta hydrolase [Geodermatophilus sp.]
MPRIARRRSAAAVALAALLLGTGAPPAGADHTGVGETPAGSQSVPQLTWADCGTGDAGVAAGVQCATADLPMDYDQPDGMQVRIAVARVPARDQADRIGSLFFNFGGPGAPAVDYLQAAGAGLFGTLNQRFDIIGFDPRGVGQSTPAVDCRVNQETEGITAQPLPTPLDIDVDAFVARMQAYVDSCLANNGAILEHLSTANVARDMDALRAAVGDTRLTYLGFSYGTVLGATYAALFPDRYRAMVLDAPVDAESYIHDPIDYVAEQTAGFEESLGRFFAACAADQVACAGFGGANPSLAYDELIAKAEVTPIPAEGFAPDPRPVTADDIRLATLQPLYSKRFWGLLGLALARAANGDGSLVRALVDSYYGRRDDGTYDPSRDRLFTISASEARFPRGDLQPYLDQGAEAWERFPHFWFSSGYTDIPWALWPIRDEDAYGGPFAVPPSAPTPLVVATTHDPATPYRGAQRLVQDLGNARLLTMDGDNHAAYGGNSACVDAATETYLVDGTLPEEDTVCPQEVPFTAHEQVPDEALSAVAAVPGAAARTDALTTSR